MPFSRAQTGKIPHLRRHSGDPHVHSTKTARPQHQPAIRGHTRGRVCDVCPDWQHRLYFRPHCQKRRPGLGGAAWWRAHHRTRQTSGARRGHRARQTDQHSEYTLDTRPASEPEGARLVPDHCPAAARPPGPTPLERATGERCCLESRGVEVAIEHDQALLSRADESFRSEAASTMRGSSPSGRTTRAGTDASTRLALSTALTWAAARRSGCYRSHPRSPGGRDTPVSWCRPARRWRAP